MIQVIPLDIQNINILLQIPSGYIEIIFISIPETLNVAITNKNTGRSPQFQVLPQGNNELMGVLCERGKIINRVQVRNG